jgi:hypothetical protein
MYVSVSEMGDENIHRLLLLMCRSGCLLILSKRTVLLCTFYNTETLSVILTCLNLPQPNYTKSFSSLINKSDIVTFYISRLSLRLSLFRHQKNKCTNDLRIVIFRICSNNYGSSMKWAMLLLSMVYNILIRKACIVI